MLSCALDPDLRSASTGPERPARRRTLRPTPTYLGRLRPHDRLLLLIVPVARTSTEDGTRRPSQGQDHGSTSPATAEPLDRGRYALLQVAAFLPYLLSALIAPPAAVLIMRGIGPRWPLSPSLCTGGSSAVPGSPWPDPAGRDRDAAPRDRASGLGKVDRCLRSLRTSPRAGVGWVRGKNVALQDQLVGVTTAASHPPERGSPRLGPRVTARAVPATALLTSWSAW